MTHMAKVAPHVFVRDTHTQLYAEAQAAKKAKKAANERHQNDYITDETKADDALLKKAGKKHLLMRRCLRLEPFESEFERVGEIKAVLSRKNDARYDSMKLSGVTRHNGIQTEPNRGGQGMGVLVSKTYIGNRRRVDIEPQWTGESDTRSNRTHELTLRKELAELERRIAYSDALWDERTAALKRVKGELH